MTLFDAENPLAEVERLLDIRVAGYKKQKLSAFCLTLTYKTLNPANILPIGESSAGKSKMMRSVLELFPIAWPEDVVYHNQRIQDILSNTEHPRTAIMKLEQAFWKKFDGLLLDGMSAQAIKRYNSDQKWFTWDGKILAIGELDSASTAAPLLRTLTSEGGGVAMVTEGGNGKHYSKLWSIQERPVVFATSASDAVENQFANRCVMLEMKPEDLALVHAKIAEEYSGMHNGHDFTKIRREIKAMPYYEGVLLPFSNAIAAKWPKQDVIMNRTLQDFYRLIHGVTLLNHKKRKSKGRWLIATREDYEQARGIFSGMKLKLSAPLLKTFGAMLELEKTFNVHRQVLLHEADGTDFTSEVCGFLIDELADAAVKSPDQIYNDISALTGKGLVRRAKWFNAPVSEYPTKKPYIYYLTKWAHEEDFVPTWEALGVEENGKT